MDEEATRPAATKEESEQGANGGSRVQVLNRGSPLALLPAVGSSGCVFFHKFFLFFFTFIHLYPPLLTFIHLYWRRFREGGLEGFSAVPPARPGPAGAGRGLRRRLAAKAGRVAGGEIDCAYVSHA